VILSEMALYRYDLPLTAPLQLGSAASGQRKGVLVRAVTEQGAVGWGEAAPLPGFSAETLDDVLAGARDVFAPWPDARISVSDTDLGKTLQGLPLGAESPPSLRFAIESAVVEGIAEATGTAVPDMLGARRSTLSLNALISHSEGPSRAAELHEEGYRAVKVKVGRAAVAEDTARVRAIRDALDPSVALRLDANRAWSLDQAVSVGEQLSDLKIDYVEEPLADPAQLRDLVARTGLSVALDETTRETSPAILRELPSVSAVVLKPTLLGGLRATWDWCRVADETGATPVLSAAYESGVGLRMIVALAATGPEVPVGVSTYGRLAADVYDPPLPLSGPTVDVAAVWAPWDAQIAWDRLTLIDRLSR